MGFQLSVDQSETKPLTGGVASDIWCVQLEDRKVCVKKALSQLKVKQDWHVPVERNAYEVAWIKTAAEAVPHSVPEVLGHDASAGIFVMEFFPPEQYQVWKTTLASGNAHVSTAKAVAKILVEIHAATALDRQVEKRFSTDELFYALRMDPYLLTTAKKHVNLADRLKTLTDVTMANKKSLVHGDVSPKNILVGPGGPILIDAECAWYGDPAFDLAFCLNHLLLKCLWRHDFYQDYLRCAEVILSVYLANVDWEPASDIELRVAHLVPGLLLARIDGKSPVEYITGQADKQLIRQFAGQLLLEPIDDVQELLRAWQRAITEQSGGRHE